MLHFVDSQGYDWNLNHVISVILLAASFTYAAKMQFTNNKDKFFHYLFSSLIAVVFIALCVWSGMPWWIGSITALIVGVIKEEFDYLDKKKRKFDVLDILFDALGVIVVTLVYMLSFVMS